MARPKRSSCSRRPHARKASDVTGPDEHILAAASATFTVSLVDASALVLAAALNELARMTVSGVCGRWRFGSRPGRQLRGAIVTPVGDDIERNAVGDSPGLSPETGRDERAAAGPVYRGTAGVTVALVIGVPMTALAMVLAAENTDDTTVEVFAANYRAPLIVVILAAAITGVILDEVFRLHLATPPSPSARGTRRTAPAPPNAVTRACATARTPEEDGGGRCSGSPGRAAEGAPAATSRTDAPATTGCPGRGAGMNPSPGRLLSTGRRIPGAATPTNRPHSTPLDAPNPRAQRPTRLEELRLTARRCWL